MIILIIEEKNEIYNFLKKHYKQNNTQIILKTIKLNELNIFFTLKNEEYEFKFNEINSDLVIIDLKQNIYPWKNKYNLLLNLIKNIILNKINLLTSGGATFCLLFLISTNYFHKKFKIINKTINDKIDLNLENNNTLIKYTYLDYSNGNLFFKKNKNWKPKYNINFHYLKLKEKYLKFNNTLNNQDFKLNNKIFDSQDYKNKFEIKILIKNNYINHFIFKNIKNNYYIEDHCLWNIHKTNFINNDFIYDIAAESSKGIELIIFKNIQVIGIKSNLKINFQFLLNFINNHDKLKDDIKNLNYLNLNKVIHSGFCINKNKKIIFKNNFINLKTKFLIKNNNNKINKSYEYRIKKCDNNKRVDKSFKSHWKTSLKNKKKNKSIIKINFKKVYNEKILFKKTKIKNKKLVSFLIENK